MPLSMGLKDVARKYQLILKNGVVMSNRHSVDLIDQRVLQLLERLEKDETPDRLSALYALFQDVKAAKGRNEAAMYAALSALDMEFERVYHDYEAWKQIVEILEMRRKLIDSEIKVVKDLKAILTAEQAYNLVAKLQAAVLRHVRDPKTLRRINYDFSRLIGEHNLNQPGDVLEGEFNDDENDDLEA